MQSRFVGASPPQSTKRSKIHRVTTSEAQQFVILSTAIFGQYVHWFGSRTHECTYDKSKCNGCERVWPRKFLGYIDVIDLHNERCFLEVTLTAANMMIAAATPDEPFRGMQLRIRKTKGGRHGRYILEFLHRDIGISEVRALGLRFKEVPIRLGVHHL